MPPGPGTLDAMQDLRTILVVDDSDFFCSVLRRSVEPVGYTAECCTEVDAALARLEAGDRPTLLVIKVDMPQIRGDHVCREVRREPGLEKLPVLLVGDLPESELERLATESGASGYLKKPFMPSVLLRWIQDHPELFEGLDEVVSNHPAGPAPRADGAPNILVVDDDRIALRVMEDDLEPLGCQVFTAQDWHQFRDQIFENPMSVVVLDVNLPDITGDKLAAFVHEFLAPPRPRIVLHSGLPASDLRRLVRQTGAQNYICKGAEGTHVRAVVQAALDSFAQSL